MTVVRIFSFPGGDIELVLGRFVPGQACEEDDDAYFTSFEFSDYF